MGSPSASYSSSMDGERDDTVPLSSGGDPHRPALNEDVFAGAPPTPSSRKGRAEAAPTQRESNLKAGYDRGESKDGSGSGGGGRGGANGSVVEGGTHAAGGGVGGVDRLVLKFTTLSDGNEKASFCLDTRGGTIGRGLENHVCVPSDTTLAKLRHACVEYSNGTWLSASWPLLPPSLPLRMAL